MLPINSDLMILGDLFDTFDINPLDFYHTYITLSGWLCANPTSYLYLVAGNHDLSKTSTTVSTFELLCKFLQHPRVLVILAPAMTNYGYVIPHLPNQGLFDEALANVPLCDNLFLHCNYDNHFAVQSDQSLNLTKEQAAAIPCTKIIIAHEHNMKVEGKIVIPGNQIASSVSDWISSPFKYYATVSDLGKEVNLVQCRRAQDEYVEVDWKSMETVTAPFMRITGKVRPEEATLAITAIAKLRGTSAALVISSAIEIQGEDSTAEFAASLESAQTFDVMKALASHLTIEQMKKVQELS